MASAGTGGAGLPFSFMGRLMRYHPHMDYQARLATPFGMLGIRCAEDALTGIDFLAPDAEPQPPRTVFARKVCEQLDAYIADADFCFDLPFSTRGTAHQERVWRVMRDIPRGQVQSYGAVAQQLHSSALAVGQACGANPIPIVIPCHRIVGKSGLGGFANHRDGYLLDIKRWLLAHEGAL